MSDSKPARPNIILIVADDMGYGDFGAFNDGLSDTPALDGLMREGITLRQHYSASPVCAPARAGLMTGRYPHRTGAIDTYEGRGVDRLALRELTMADMFNSAGYATGLVGKWHLGALDTRYHPNARGFDEFAGFRGGWQDYYQWRLDRNGSFEKADGRYLTDVFTEEATAFIGRHADEPFFLNVTYNAPHFPLQAPDDVVAPYLEDERFGKGPAYIYAMNRRMDSGVADILAALSKHGIEDNTIVMFTSDNGPQLSGDWDWDTTRFNCGFNGAKTFVYEGGIRVPMVLRWPDGGLSGGGSIDDMLHFTDWFPTLIGTAGVDVPTDRTIDGRDVMPLLRGETADLATQRFWQWNRYTPLVTANAANRDGAWKLLRPKIDEAFAVQAEDGEQDRGLKYEPETHTELSPVPEPERSVPDPGPALLFNIDDDPLETRDLAAEEPARASRMLADLETWFAEVEAERATIDDVW